MENLHSCTAIWKVAVQEYCGLLSCGFGWWIGQRRIDLCGTAAGAVGKNLLCRLEGFLHHEPAHAQAGGRGGLLDALLFFLAHPEGNLFTESLLGPSRTVNAGSELPGPLHTFFRHCLTSPLYNRVWSGNSTNGNRAKNSIDADNRQFHSLGSQFGVVTVWDGAPCEVPDGGA